MQRYIFNETVYLGQDARFCLKDELKNRGFKKVLVVSDATIIKSKVLEKVTAILDETGIKYQIYSDVVPNPTVENVKNGLKILNKS